MAIHSRIGGSKASQWMNCPGSVLNQALVNLEAPMPEESPYAAEGTEAHKVAELLVNGWEPPPNVDPDMIRYGLQYKAGLKTFRFMYPGVGRTEANLWAPQISKDFFGTIDYDLFSPPTDTTIIVDYKYGAGEYVGVVENPQLLHYGVLSSEARGRYTLKYKFVIFQPRGDKPGWRIWDTTYGRVNSYRKHLIIAINRVENNDVETKAGKWCRWCLAKVHCKAYYEANIKPVLDFKGQLVGLKKDEIAAIREKKETLAQWMKVADDYLKSACALSDDGTVGGWQVVKQKGITEFIDKIGIELNFPRDEFPNFYKSELKTPKQILEAHPELKDTLEYTYNQKEYPVLKRITRDFSDE